MDASQNLYKLATMGLAVALVAVVAVTAPFAPAQANHQPADKMAVDGSTLAVMTTNVTEGEESKTVTLLSAEMRTSSTTDVIFQVTLECALWTDVTTVGNDESEAIATVEVWVEVDGEPVAISEDDTDGKAVFCNRAYKVVTTQFENENATIERYLSTRSANAFNWFAYDLGGDVHTIEVKGKLTAQADSGLGTATAKAAIGARTLVAEPVKLAQHATVE